ncbi:MAG: hypothetical protein HN389_05690 [Clostridia bacterium]|nr:hypothetical protein [Clostridia bacterium]
MKQKRPGFWAYLKSVVTHNSEVTDKNGIKYKRQDIALRLIIAGVALPILLLLRFLNYADAQLRNTISIIALVVFVLGYPVLVYLLAKFEMVEDDEEKQGIAKIVSDGKSKE